MSLPQLVVREVLEGSLGKSVVINDCGSPPCHDYQRLPHSPYVSHEIQHDIEGRNERDIIAVVSFHTLFEALSETVSLSDHVPRTLQLINNRRYHL
ncbi:hypothetical protein J6590_073559 [Homalodisca vitripennis]|nr:hypothetical protein J6590_073559 [Homalodisca vitripennis]